MTVRSMDFAVNGLRKINADGKKVDVTVEDLKEHILPIVQEYWENGLQFVELCSFEYEEKKTQKKF